MIFAKERDSGSVWACGSYGLFGCYTVVGLCIGLGLCLVVCISVFMTDLARV